MPEFQIEMLWKCFACNEIVKGRFTECTKCGKPKNEKAEYFMPEDLDNANPITDSNLISMANDGANWNCKYCGSDQRNSKNECINCGADKTNIKEQIIVQEAKQESFSDVKPDHKNKKNYSKFIIGGLLSSVLIGAATYNTTNAIEAQAISFKWTAIAHIDKNVIEDHSGFNYPTNAFEIKDNGKKVFSYIDVLDHYEKQNYQEEQIVGYKKEKYKVQEVCGSDCKKIPESCSTSEPVCSFVESNCTNVKTNCTKTKVNCKSNKNGFANCTGGDEVCDYKKVCKDKEKVCTKSVKTCTPESKKCIDKYCDVEKTKDVPIKEMVTKTKDVPKYRKDPVYKNHFSWKESVWKFFREENIYGDNKTLDADKKLSLNEGEKLNNIFYKCSISFKVKEKSINYNTNCFDEFNKVEQNKVYKVYMIGDTIIKIKN